jgi:predicted transcriptional regulator
MTTVRETSIESHNINQGYGTLDCLTTQIIDWVRKTGWVSRKQISQHFKAETSTVSGIVTPLIEAGILVECHADSRMQCPITGRRVYFVAHASVRKIQQDLFL